MGGRLRQNKRQDLRGSLALAGRVEDLCRHHQDVLHLNGVMQLARIVGSEGRSEDFDGHFRPQRTHNRERWIRVASAWLQGLALPAVQLVQVGDAYYVRDGNHRVSVARAFGQESIDAEVTVWETGATPSPARA